MIKITTIIITFLVSITHIMSQSYLGQKVPDVTETDCDDKTERIYDVLSTGKPILIFKTDMICSNTTAWGTTVRQYSDLYASQYRTWICADFWEASEPSEQCHYMKEYKKQSGITSSSVFTFIDTSSMGPYDTSSRSISDILCYQGYTVIGLDSTVIYVGNNVNEAVEIALSASQITSSSSHEKQENNSIFPNPVSSTLQLDVNEDIESIKIFNASGHLIYEPKVNFAKTIDVSSLIEGVYLITLKGKTGNITSTKFIKN